MGNDTSAAAHDFTVVRDGSTSYHLTGTVTTSSTGWTVEIHPMSDGIVSDPEIARFLVNAMAPGEGDATEDVVTDQPVEATFEDAAELTVVFVHLQGATFGQDRTDFEVPVS
ncbi:MAG TPA: hypothetical protein VGO60_10380 [Iamia sp.]|jgi:hypothetical protein|nr:hypothetical protein [Iamia sp.]